MPPNINFTEMFLGQAAIGSIPCFKSSVTYSHVPIVSITRILTDNERCYTVRTFSDARNYRALIDNLLITMGTD